MRQWVFDYSQNGLPDVTIKTRKATHVRNRDSISLQKILFFYFIEKKSRFKKRIIRVCAPRRRGEAQLGRAFIPFMGKVRFLNLFLQHEKFYGLTLFIYF